MKKSATNANNFFENIREKLKTVHERECDSCADLLNKLKEKKLEIEGLKNDLEQSKNSAENFKNKYRAMKQKYKNKKCELREKQDVSENSIELGSIKIPVSKLSLCREHDYSKYVGDLLDICFGREVLAESVLKESVNKSLKTNILDPKIINDIIEHVMKKYEKVSVLMVRAAVRQKLNTCHKSKKRIENKK